MTDTVANTLSLSLSADTTELEGALDRCISKFRALTVAAQEAQDAVASIPSSPSLIAKLNNLKSG